MHGVPSVVAWKVLIDYDQMYALRLRQRSSLRCEIVWLCKDAYDSLAAQLDRLVTVSSFYYTRGAFSAFLRLC